MAKKYDIKALKKRFKEFKNQAKQTSSNVIQAGADTIVFNAKLKAPSNNGQLKQSIGKEKINQGLGAVIYANAPYAPFVEFGTGAKVQVPTELQDLANQFKGKGGGFEKMLIAIQDWCRNKGIDPKAAYPIAVSILKKGLKARPFLWPAFVEERDKLPAKLENAMQVIAKEFSDSK